MADEQATQTPEVTPAPGGGGPEQQYNPWLNLLFMTPVIGLGFAAMMKKQNNQAFQNQQMQNQRFMETYQKAVQNGDVPFLTHPATQKFASQWIGKDLHSAYLKEAEMRQNIRNLVLGGATGVQPEQLGVPSGQPTGGITGGRAIQMAPDESGTFRQMVEGAGPKTPPISATGQMTPPVGMTPPTKPVTAMPSALAPRTTAPAIPTQAEGAPSRVDQLVQAVSGRLGPQPGATISAQVGEGLSVSTRSLTAEERGQVVWQHGAKMKATPGEILDAADKVGATFSQQQYNRLAAGAYSELQGDVATQTGLQGQQLERATAREVFNRYGVTPAGITPWTTNEEAERYGVSWMANRLGTKPFPQLIGEFRSRQIPGSQNNELITRLGQEEFGRNFMAARQGGMSDRDAFDVALASVGGNLAYTPPQLSTQMFAPPTLEPRVGTALATQPTATGQPTTPARATAEQIKKAAGGGTTAPEIAGKEAGAVKAAQEAVPERQSAPEQEKSIAALNSLQAVERIKQLFKPEYADPVKNRGVPWFQNLQSLAGGRTVKEVSETWGKLDPQEVQFRAELARGINNAAFALGGVRIEATTNPNAFIRATKDFPELAQDPKTFVARLNELEDRLRREYESRQKVARSQNLRELPELSASTGPLKYEEKTIRVVGPDGVEHDIPASTDLSKYPHLKPKK